MKDMKWSVSTRNHGELFEIILSYNLEDSDGKRISFSDSFATLELDDAEQMVAKAFIELVGDYKLYGLLPEKTVLGILKTQAEAVTPISKDTFIEEFGGSLWNPDNEPEIFVWGNRITIEDFKNIKKHLNESGFEGMRENVDGFAVTRSTLIHVFLRSSIKEEASIKVRDVADIYYLKTTD